MKNLILLFISLFIFSCDSDDNPVSVSNEVDVDWILVKSPNVEDSCYDCETSYNGIGYYFYYTQSSNLSNLNIDEVIVMDEWGNLTGGYQFVFLNQPGTLSFNYNNQYFSFDVSDSFVSEIPEVGMYRFETEFDELQRIIYNQDMNYFTLFGESGFHGITLNSSSPNELIDFR